MSDHSLQPEGNRPRPISSDVPLEVAGLAFDVVVVGGGPAGLSGALTLARARRSVLVVDGGQPRNAPAVNVGAHGILGHDGISPLELLRLGRAEVRLHGGQVVSGHVDTIRRPENEGGLFTVVFTDEDGRAVSVHARRVLITTGLADELPALPGVRERWGRDVLHCVYCHGWEVRDQRIGVLGSYHQALLFRQMTDDVTLFLPASTDLDDEQWSQLAGLGIEVVVGALTELRVEDDALTGVVLEAGNTIAVDVLVVSPRFVARAGFVTDLGLQIEDHPMGVGVQLATEAGGRTAVPGVWAAGNVADVIAGVPGAAAAGVAAAAAMNMDLIMTDARTAADARDTGQFGASTTAPPVGFTHALEAENSRRVLGTRIHGLDSLM